MKRSPLQESFMSEVAATFLAAKSRIVSRLKESPGKADEIIDHELRGLYHGLFVIFDGGTALADEGLITIADESGVTFERWLHERCFDYWK